MRRKGSIGPAGAVRRVVPGDAAEVGSTACAHRPYWLPLHALEKPPENEGATCWQCEGRHRQSQTTLARIEPRNPPYA